ncbi:hypothetical protein [Furfurilactobacillus siliginis]|uniref:hypothetical protein n=1 Tax=Furfurilactobacillus siliginis TaxID=348151 RepID=UPI000A3E9786|nr:hypothetical protein [Furfurilactobacillus siliginis]
MTKYIIFGIELLAFVLWAVFGPRQSLLLYISGFVLIVIVSQLFHHFLGAR